MSNENFIVINLQSFGTTSQNIKEEHGSSSASQAPPYLLFHSEKFEEKVSIFREEIALSKRV